MKSKVTAQVEISRHFHDGMSIMFGGFMGQGTPPTLVQMLLDSGVKNVTLIGNDTGTPGSGVAPLVEAGRVCKGIVSHKRQKRCSEDPAQLYAASDGVRLRFYHCHRTCRVSHRIDGQMTLTEHAPGVSVDDIRHRTEAEFVVSPELHEMPTGKPYPTTRHC